MITAHGELYKVKIMDWIYCILSFGLYYCCVVREKKFERTALIITNKRLIALDIRQRAGMVPDHMSEMMVALRSFFPGEVLGGYLHRFVCIRLSFSLFLFVFIVIIFC